jgi:hypothetical protein
VSELTKTLAKIATLPRLLDAATLLKSHGLIDGEPHEYVKRYVLANPDINATLLKRGWETT